MPITNFNFPRVTVNQKFAAVTPATDSVLPVCIIGPQYRVHDYATDAAALPTAKLENGSLTQLTGTVPAVKQVSLYMPNALANYAKDAIVGATLNKDAYTVTLAADAGSFAGVAINDALATDVVAGDLLRLILADGETTVDVQVIDVTNNVATFVLVNGAPTLKDEPVTISKAFRIITTRCECTVSEGTITVPSDIKVTIEGSAGIPKQATVWQCPCVYVEYRQPVTSYVRRLGVISVSGDADQICKDMFGNCTEKNPLGLAVLMAAKQAGSAMVYFVGIDPAATETQQAQIAAYAQAIDFLGKDDTVYSIVPCTYTRSVIQTLLRQINEQSSQEVPNYKILWYAANTPQATDRQQLIQGIIDQKVASDRRAAMVYADDAVYNGAVIPNWAVAAAAAGMRSKEQPHRPLSNLQYTSFGVKQTHGLTASQLRRLGSQGIWLIANNAQGIAINKRQLTTAAANDVNYDEQSLTTNVDSICKALKSIGADMVGNSNINPGLLALLTIQCNTLMQSYTVTKQSAFVGPQLLSVQLVQLAQDPIVLDRVYAHIKGQPPKPFNQFDITFTMV